MQLKTFKIGYIVFLLSSCQNKTLEKEFKACGEKIEELENSIQIKSDSISVLRNRVKGLASRDSIKTYYYNNKSNLNYLNYHKGKYPFEFDLYKEGELKDRLLKLLGSDTFKKFQKFNSVQFPIEIINNERTTILGLAPQGGGDKESCLYVNIMKDEISVAIRHYDRLDYYTEKNDRKIEDADRDILRWIYDKIVKVRVDH